MNKNTFRSVCGQFTTGITVITTINGTQNIGFTANSFTSVSLDPPLILFCLAKEAHSNIAFQSSAIFGINILTEHQKNISNRFASSKLGADERFENIKLLPDTKAPIFEDSVAYLEGDIMERHEGGDHWIYIGQVHSGAINGGLPLLYFSGSYSQLSSED